MKTNIVIVVQARMGSTRLPGKHLKKILGRPLLSFLIERLRQIKIPHTVVIATTNQSIDDPIVDLCVKENVQLFRGDEENVLDRYYKTAKQFKADVIVRITADCPLIDPAIVEQTINFYLENYPKFDYVSNSLVTTFPRGMDVEVFSFKSFKTVVEEGISPEEIEHVTPYYYRHPEKFKIWTLKNDRDLSHLRLTVDTLEDLQLITHIIEELYPKNPTFHLQDVVHILDVHPEWLAINAHVKQKLLQEKKPLTFCS